MLCDSCLKEIYQNLSSQAKLVIATVSDNKSYNKNQVMIRANLPITATNYAIQELLGAGLIEIRAFSNSKLVKLTQNGIKALGVLK